jgi:hypothetical protein
VPELKIGIRQAAASRSDVAPSPRQAEQNAAINGSVDTLGFADVERRPLPEGPSLAEVMTADPPLPVQISKATDLVDNVYPAVLEPTPGRTVRERLANFFRGGQSPAPAPPETLRAAAAPTVATTTDLNALIKEKRK